MLMFGQLFYYSTGYVPSVCNDWNEHKLVFLIESTTLAMGEQVRTP